MSLQSVDLLHFFHKQIDEARTKPENVIQQLKKRQFSEDDLFSHSEVRNIKYKTSEGQAAVDEAIQFLETMKQEKKLKISQNLCEVAYQVGCSLARQKHIQNPQKYMDAVEREIGKTTIKDYGSIMIIVEYGFRMDPEIIPSIIVDDGDQRRSRRDWLLSGKTEHIGLSVHEHEEFDYMLLILLTNRLTEQKHGCFCRTF